MPCSAGLFVYRQFDWQRLGPMLVETASLSGAILIIIGTASAMAWGLTQSGFSRSLAQEMAQLPGGAVGFMAVSIVDLYRARVSVLEGIPAIVLFGPLLFPIARELGIHEVHYAMVVVLAMGLGSVRAAVRRRLLRRLRHRPGRIRTRASGRSRPTCSRCSSAPSLSRRCRGCRSASCDGARE